MRDTNKDPANTQEAVRSITQQATLELLKVEAPDPTAVADELREAAEEEIPGVSSATRDNVVDSANQAVQDATEEIRETAIANLEPALGKASPPDAGAIIDSTLAKLELEAADLDSVPVLESEIAPAAALAITENTQDLSAEEEQELEEATVDALAVALQGGINTAEEETDLNPDVADELSEEPAGFFDGTTNLFVVSVGDPALLSLFVGIGSTALQQLLRIGTKKLMNF